MPASLTVVSNTDLAQPNSPNPWLLLCHVSLQAMVNSAGEALEAQDVYLVHNNEDIVWNGQTYIASSFDFQSLDIKPGELPAFSMMVSNINGAVGQQVDIYDGGNGALVRFYVVSSVDIENSSPAQEYQFELQGAHANDQWVTFTLASVSPMRYPFPAGIYFWDHCPRVYNNPTLQANMDPRGVYCGYFGTAATCDHTLNGANGCRAHNNQSRFGGFPSIINQAFRYASSV